MNAEALLNLLANASFSSVLLLFIYLFARGASAFLRPWLEGVFTRIIGWFDAQTELVQSLRVSLGETATNVDRIAKTQEIMARGLTRTNRIWNRVVGVMEASPCVSKEQIEAAQQEYDSDDLTEKDDSSSGD